MIIGNVFWKVGVTHPDRGLTYKEANVVMRSTSFLMNVSYQLPSSIASVSFADKKVLAAEGAALGLYLAWMHGMSELNFIMSLCHLRSVWSSMDTMSLTIFIFSWRCFWNFFS